MKLGAFIQKSERIVVIYTNIYLLKLWTIYEVACFLALHPISRMVVVPPAQPLLVLGGSLVIYLSRIVALLIDFIERRGTSLGWQSLSQLFMCFGGAYLFRPLAHIRVEIR